MMKLAMSTAASALLRALLARAQVERDRVYLRQFRSTDWQSLTFLGERHEIELRVPGPESRAIAQRLVDGLEEADFALPGHIVGDIRAEPPQPLPDGSMLVVIGALTIAD